MGEESRTEEEDGARRGQPAASVGRTKKEGRARRGRPAATKGRTEEEAGTESNEEEEVAAVRIGGGATGEDRCGGLRGIQ